MGFFKKDKYEEKTTEELRQLARGRKAIEDEREERRRLIDQINAPKKKEPSKIGKYLAAGFKSISKAGVGKDGKRRNIYGDII